MENVFFTSDPITLALIALITVILIALGRKLEITAFPIINVMNYLCKEQPLESLAFV